MRKWEYCNFDYSEPTRVVMLDQQGEISREIEGCGGFMRSKESKAACAVYQLGEMGWEAFQMHDGLLWFKRPKQD